MRTLVPALLIAATLAACGADDEQPATSPPPDSTRLTVEVTGTGAGPTTIEYSCGGAEPCDSDRLDKLEGLTAPPDDPPLACTQQYGGPEEAHVTGTLRGRPVDVTINRADGCGIAHYEELFAALDREPPLAG
jgi:hypothetical protein